MSKLSDSGRAIGLLGGTFDPVHFGHLRAAIECANAFALAEVRLMPCNPVHRQLSPVSSIHRKKMLELSVQNSRILSMEDCEINQACPTYTIDTLKLIRQKIGYDIPLYFIVGADAFNTIETWKQYTRLFEEANFIVIKRPGAELNLENRIIADNFTDFTGIHEPFGKVYSLAVRALDISSTQIRQLVQQHQSIEFLLPQYVELYIQQQGLYQ